MALQPPADAQLGVPAGSTFSQGSGARGNGGGRGDDGGGDGGEGGGGTTVHVAPFRQCVLAWSTPSALPSTTMLAVPPSPVQVVQ